MTLEFVIYWIVVIFFALPIVLMALVYIWRTFANIFRSQNEDEQPDDEYWNEPEKRQDD